MLDPHDEHKAWNRKAWIAFSLLSATILVLIFSHMSSCSVPAKKKVVIAASSCPDGMQLGDTKEEICASGQKLSVCTQAGLQVKVNTCDGSCVSYEDGVASVFESNGCADCHAQLQDYDTAKPWANRIVTRVNLAPDDRFIMPPSPRSPLDQSDKDLLKAWSDSGAKKNCALASGEGRNGEFLDINFLGGLAIKYSKGIDPSEHPNIRFGICMHRFNEGASDQDIARCGEALSKALNSVNVRNAKLINLKPLEGSNGTIWPFNIEDFGIDAAKWVLIERADKIRIVDKTNVGRLLRDITLTNQPWFHIDNLVDITQRNADVYYALTETPLLIGELRAKLGVDFAGDLQRLDALSVGGNKSPISLQKNRRITRFESDDGYYWETFDPVDINGVPQRNLYGFPGFAEAGTVLNFKFDASEVIYTLRNGMQGYALYNAQGIRQNAAPLNIVADNRSPITPEIKNSISCHRCHAQGIIPMVDEIRAHVIANATEFNRVNPREVEILRGLYEPQVKADQAYRADSDRFASALSGAGVNPTAEDPINLATDRFLLDWDLAKTAAFLLLRQEEFKDCLNLSVVGRGQIGQLLTGGKITYNQFVEVVPALIRDCRLFQEPID